MILFLKHGEGLISQLPGRQLSRLPIRVETRFLSPRGCFKFQRVRMQALVPCQPCARLARYDCTGLCWLLRGREVVALTEFTAAIRHPSGSITRYRRFNKPALGPVGDSLDDFSD